MRWIKHVIAPALVLVLGFSFTLLAAVVNERSAEREQALVFDSAVVSERQRFEASLEAHVDEFDDAVDFVTATHPASPGSFEAFFAEATADQIINEADPGVSVIELVEADAIEALEARESLLGTTDFTVIKTSPADEPSLVITRTSQEVLFLGRSIVGFDVGGVIGEQLASRLTESERFAFEMESEPALAPIFDQAPTSTGRPRMIFVEAIDQTETGNPRTWVARSFNTDRFLETYATTSNGELNVALVVAGADVQIVDVDAATEVTAQEAQLSQGFGLTTPTSRWDLIVWADDDLGIDTTLFGQTGAWILGLFLTLAIFSLVALWSFSRYRFESSEFELRHARTLATTDKLTGLLNRQGFVDGVHALDEITGGTVFFIDLDGFKAVNDTLGHSEGDRVLRSVADIVRAQFRSTDLVSRFGGDEFIVYSPDLSRSDVGEEIAMRVISAVEVADLGVSCSIGAAQQSPLAPTDLDTLIRHADRAMYRAKAGGGNGYVSATGVGEKR